MSRLLTALLLVLFARPDALVAQIFSPNTSIHAGARVRITRSGQAPRVAVVVARNADTLLVRWPGLANAVAVPLADVSRLQLSAGRHRNVRKGAAVGTLTGSAVGAVLGAATYSPCASTEPFGCLLEPTSRSESAMVGAIGGGVLGLIVGTLAGLPSRDDWRDVPLAARRVAVAVTPRGRGTNLGVSLRF